MPLARLVLRARLGSSPLTKCWSTVELRVHSWPSANNSVQHAIFSCLISTESMMLDMLKVDQYPT